MNRINYSLAIILVVAAATPVRAVDPTWARQPGYPGWDANYAVSADGLGNVYATGETQVSKYSAAGDLLWIKPISTSSYQTGKDVSADGLGSVYIAGEQDAPNGDAFVTKLDDAGSFLWTHKFSTTKYDSEYAISADKLGNVYLAGTTAGSLAAPSAGSYDALVSKLSSTGTVLWTRQFGASGYDIATGVSPDGAGHVYVSGMTDGSLDRTNPNPTLYDAFLRKYSDDGTLLWARQFGTSRDDEAWDVAVDQFGNVFTAGTSNGTWGESWAGSLDVFVSKFDTDGNLQWTHQFGTSRYDECFNLSADGLGNVYVAGSFNGIDDGQDAFVRKYDSAGNLLWDTQFGTPVYDSGRGVSADGLGNVYVSGLTGGSLGGPNAGDYDAFVAKFTDPVPEPSTFALAAIAAIGLIGCITTSRNQPRTHRMRSAS